MPEMPADEPGRTWWRDGVLYQIYPRSYMDTNADGVGDLRGITERLDHLAWLGVEGIWRDPVMPSPNEDWGYDVADYVDVDPALGSLADADELIAQAAERGIRVIMDLVPNHTSDRHAWFLDAKSSRTARHRDWYVWADPKADGSPPNNWTMAFDPRQPAWTFDEHTGQYYLNQFLPSQPDLNWWNPEVRDAFDDILRFWFDRGVAAFRIDVAHSIVKDAQLRDNPPSTKDDHWYVQLRGQRTTYNACRPEVHDVLRRWRKLADSYDPPRALIGETYVLEPEQYASFYGNGDELNLAFNFMLIHARFNAPELRTAIETAEQLVPANAWPVWTAGNHDTHRFPSRWADNDPARARTVMVMLMGLRGTPFLYYGDEIGMTDTDVPPERVLDPVGKFHGPRLGRDPERTPMQWTAENGAGFSEPGVEPWLPYGDYRTINVEAQRNDPDSMLTLTRDLIRLRNALPEFRTGNYETLPASDDRVWAWRRGDRLVVACNISDAPADVAGVGPGAIRISTIRSRDDEPVAEALHLEPWEAAIVVCD
ncbi:MAG TPA: alpha-amylase family glycosyl hydrolase [Acidimicrobiia bacterium]|nr:alpha-amylase family glycosyl hydrolase [Acidimicrobiia bacterium]